MQPDKKKDALIAPMFLNFTVSVKKVENYSLNSPFDRLISKDFLKGGLIISLARTLFES